MSDAGPHAPRSFAFDRAYAKFHSTICRLAASLIGRRLRRRVDPDDIAQSVFRTVFRRCADGLCEFDDSGALRSYLLEVTANKVRKQAQVNCAQKRDMRSEVDADELSELSIAPPSPSESLALDDEYEFLTRGFSMRDLQILQLCLEGHATPEIARLTGCSRWTVRRVLDGFGSRWRIRDEC